MAPSIFSRRKRQSHSRSHSLPSQHPQSPPPPPDHGQSNALLAASLAFTAAPATHNPNPHLSSSAAAAALKYAAAQPPNPVTVIGKIPTKRMLERRGSYSSSIGSLSGGSAGARRAASRPPPPLERRGSSGSLMSERKFRSSEVPPPLPTARIREDRYGGGGNHERGGPGDRTSVSSVGSWRRNLKQGQREGSLDSGVGSYSVEHPPPVPEIPQGIYEREQRKAEYSPLLQQSHHHHHPHHNHNHSHSHGHQHQCWHNDHHHEQSPAILRGPGTNTNFNTQRPPANRSTCNTCECSCHGSTPYHQAGEVDEYERLSLEPALHHHCQPVRQSRYPSYNTYTYKPPYSTAELGEAEVETETEADEIRLSPRSTAPARRPSAAPARRTSAPPPPAAIQPAAKSPPESQNIFRLLRTDVNGAPPPAPTPSNAPKRFPSARGVRHSEPALLPTPITSSPESIRHSNGRGGAPVNRDVSRKRGGSGAELSPPPSDSDHHFYTTHHGRRGASNDSYITYNSNKNNNNSNRPTQPASRTDLAEEITSPTPRRRQRRGGSGGTTEPPPVPITMAMPTLRGPPPPPAQQKSRNSHNHHQGDVLAHGTLREDTATPIGSGSGNGRREHPFVDKAGMGLQVGSDAALTAAMNAVGGKKKNQAPVMQESARIAGLGISKGGDERVGIPIPARSMAIPYTSSDYEEDELKAEEEEEENKEEQRGDYSSGYGGVPGKHGDTADSDAPRTPPLTSIPEEQDSPRERERERVRENERERKRGAGKRKLKQQMTRKYREVYRESTTASDGSSSSSSYDERDDEAGRLPERRTHTKHPQAPLSGSTKPISSREKTPTQPQSLPTPTLLLHPATPQADSAPSPPPSPPLSPSTTKPVRKQFLRVLSTPEIPTRMHDPPPRSVSPGKPAMKKLKPDLNPAVGAKNVQFSDTTSEIEYEEEEEEEEEEEIHWGGGKVEEKEKKGGFGSWFRRDKGKEKKGGKKGGKLKRKGAGSEAAQKKKQEQGQRQQRGPPMGEMAEEGEEDTEVPVKLLSPETETEEVKPATKSTLTISIGTGAGSSSHVPGEWVGTPTGQSSTSSLSPSTSAGNKDQGGYFAGVKVVAAEPLQRQQQRPPSTCDVDGSASGSGSESDNDNDGTSSVSGMSIYEDAPEELPFTSPPTPPPANGSVNTTAATTSDPQPSSSFHHHAKPLRTSTPSSSSTPTPTRKSRQRQQAHDFPTPTSSPSPPPAQARYTLPAAAITPRTQALIDERKRQIAAGKTGGATRPASSTSDESGMIHLANGHTKPRSTPKPGGGGMMNRASFRDPASPTSPTTHKPASNSGFLGLGALGFRGASGKAKDKESEKHHRLRITPAKRAGGGYVSRFAHDSSSDEEAGGERRGGLFESRFAGDSSSDEDADGAAELERERERAVEMILRGGAAAAGGKRNASSNGEGSSARSSTVGPPLYTSERLDTGKEKEKAGPAAAAAAAASPPETIQGNGSGSGTGHREQRVSESSEEIITASGTVGGERDRAMRRGRWGLFSGGGKQREKDRKEKEREKGVAPAGENGAGEVEGLGGKEREGGKEKEKDAGGVFKKLFGRGR